MVHGPSRLERGTARHRAEGSGVQAKPGVLPVLQRSGRADLGEQADHGRAAAGRIDDQVAEHGVAAVREHAGHMRTARVRGLL
ncbi:hypothetical protein [Streptomyces sp. NPDC054834]